MMCFNCILFTSVEYLYNGEICTVSKQAISSLKSKAFTNISIYHQ